MKIYGLAQDVTVNAGHGDSYTEFRICPIGFYGTDGFPPFFLSRAEAILWKSKDDRRSGLIVVELELVEAK